MAAFDPYGTCDTFSESKITRGLRNPNLNPDYTPLPLEGQGVVRGVVRNSLLFYLPSCNATAPKMTCPAHPRTIVRTAGRSPRIPKINVGKCPKIDERHLG